MTASWRRGRRDSVCAAGANVMLFCSIKKIIGLVVRIVQASRRFLQATCFLWPENNGIRRHAPSVVGIKAPIFQLGQWKTGVKGAKGPKGSKGNASCSRRAHRALETWLSLFGRFCLSGFANRHFLHIVVWILTAKSRRRPCACLYSIRFGLTFFLTSVASLRAADLAGCSTCGNPQVRLPVQQNTGQNDKKKARVKCVAI